ncbi:hypothetical protein Bca101_076820 [Brassica carinata]
MMKTTSKEAKVKTFDHSKAKMNRNTINAAVDSDLVAVSSSYGSRSTVTLDANLSNSLTLPMARRSCGPIERPTLQRILEAATVVFFICFKED